VTGLVGGGLYLFYSRWLSKRRRLEECEPIPDNRHFEADLPLVHFKNCVVSHDMVANGTLENVAAFQLRDDDLIVASFPKSGTTWLQEVVYRLRHLRGKKDEYEKDVMETKFPYLEFVYPGLKDIEERKGERFIKTHLPRHLLPESAKTSKAKVSEGG